MPRGRQARLCGWGVAYAAFFFGSSGLAADLSGVRLEVLRGPGAQACPDAQALTDALRTRLGSASTVEGAPVLIEVEIRSTGKTFAATVRASGGRRGVRTLEAGGPSCSGLTEALVVSLSVLLDHDAGPDPFVPPKKRASGATKLSFWLSGAGALTWNLPEGFSDAVLGEVGARYDRHALWLGAVFAPERDLDFGPGDVHVRANGGQLRACTLLFGGGAFRTDACAVGMLLALRGRARGYNDDNSKVRPWWLGGAGADLAFLPAPWLATGLSPRLLIAPKKEAFSIEGLPGRAYSTPLAVGWLGLFLSVKIW